jgi:hypothetical protein
MLGCIGAWNCEYEHDATVFVESIQIVALPVMLSPHCTHHRRSKLSVVKTRVSTRYPEFLGACLESLPGGCPLQTRC